MFLALLAACDNEPLYKGMQMSPYFPQDGERLAEYTNEDTDNVTWKLTTEKVEPTERVDDEEVVTWEWWRDDTGDVIGSIKWSSTSGNGIKIHAYSVGTGDFVTFETPVLVTDDDDYMNRDEYVETETDGYHFTSTYVGQEDCPVLWGLDDWQCAHITIVDGDDDTSNDPLFIGDWWLVQRYGPAWMKLTGYDEKWNLSHYDWEVTE